MKLLALLNWRVVAGLILTVLLAGSHWKVYHMGQAGIRAERTAEKLEESKQALRLTEKAIEKANAMQADADQLRKDKNAQINALNTRLAAALDGLRDRPERPREGDMPAPAVAGAAPRCTGAGLYREDAGVLIREAARADRLLAGLAECQALYNKVRDSLIKPN